jgi:hypothetical protein
MLSTIPGATAASVVYAVEQGWIELEGAHSACLTEERQAADSQGGQLRSIRLKSSRIVFAMTSRSAICCGMVPLSSVTVHLAPG